MFAGIEINLHVMIKVIGFRLIKKCRGLMLLHIFFE